MTTWTWALILGVAFLIALSVVSKAVKKISQYERGLVERFGRYKETLEPGLHFIVPFADQVAARVDMRESVLDIEPQAVITKDNVTVTVDAVIYYQVVDPKAIRYEVQSFWIINLRIISPDVHNNKILISRIWSWKELRTI